MSGSVYNLHNHTPFSDGAYTVDELVEAHLDLHLDIDGIGMSDTLFRTPSSREVSNERDFERVFAGETSAYLAETRAAAERHAGSIRVFCGCEISWPLNKNMLEPMRRMVSGFDYVLFENVDWNGLTTLASQSRRWPCPIGLSHTAVNVHFPNTSQDQVVRTMANARIFYEVNSIHVPLLESDRWFNVLPQHRVMVAIGTDTHDDLHCLSEIAPMLEFVRRKGLTDRMLEPRPRGDAVAAE
ncbi:MAG: hypothetical protein KDA32_13365 [Phycisphaerales bacterium]|nr:hypothetical protein [Phycisphaerales bacterium]